MSAAVKSTLDDNGEAGADEEEEPRFSFYSMLPNFEVVIPESESDVSADHEPQAIVDPGVYVLQAGSFSEFVDADRRRATLAMQGIESRIQRVTIDDKTYHRVRIGPIDDLDELNILRSRLRAANIDVLRIRLGD
jgi:cell division protein FtsN